MVMGYCLLTAKGAAETLKFNMAIILLPVCRNTITWIRSTRLGYFVPFDDNINFHKVQTNHTFAWRLFRKTLTLVVNLVGSFKLSHDYLIHLQTIAAAIGVGVILHVGSHLACDFPRLVQSSDQSYNYVKGYFGPDKPTYLDLFKGWEAVTGILMVIFMAVAFTLATRWFRRSLVKLPKPFDRLTGFNAFWYSHHLFVIVYVLLVIHGIFLYLENRWYCKTVRVMILPH